MRALGVIGGVAAAWVAVTWPQALHLSDRVGGHIDALFSVWRLAWIGAALSDPRLQLWDAPIFYPATNTLAFSDSVLLPGAIARLLSASGLSPVTVYNLILALFMIGAGVALAALVRVVAGHWLPGLVAGIAFALNPHQAEHFERLELQTGLWMPLLFLCWHLAVTRASPWWAAAAMLTVAGQWLSGMYFALFLCATLPCLALTWTWIADAAARRRVLVAAAAALVVSLVVVGATTGPYFEARATVGERSVEETARYSAVAGDFIRVPPRNLLYAGRLPPSAAERSLFPGVVVLVLGAIGVAAAPARIRWLYLLVGLVALDLTMGVNGLIMTWLRDWLVPLRGIRAPARAATLLMVPVSVFVGIGTAAVLGRVASPRWRVAAGLALALVAVVEYRSRNDLWPVAPPAPMNPVGLTPVSIVAEFPMPQPDRLDASVDAFYMVDRIGLWPRMVNGSSGAFPPHYVDLARRTRQFPGDAAIRALRHIGVTHVTVHERFYRERYQGIVTAIEQGTELARLATYREPDGEVRVYALVDARRDDGK